MLFSNHVRKSKLEFLKLFWICLISFFLREIKSFLGLEMSLFKSLECCLRIFKWKQIVYISVLKVERQEEKCLDDDILVIKKVNLGVNEFICLMKV
jgi:hypothetical protein